MGLDSYLEIYTTMYGWYFSSIIVRAFSDTGLLALPFVFMLAGAWIEAHQRGAEGGGVAWLIRKLEVQAWTSLFVLVTCVNASNLTSLTHNSLNFTPMRTTVEPNPQTATGANPLSTYGTAFQGTPANAAVPPWWFTVMSVSSGLNASIRAGIATGVRDFRMIQDLAQIATVGDPRLRNEIQRFYSECFVPARSRYLRAGTVSAQAQAAIAANGEADVDWMGSHAFRNDPALYAAIFSRYDVPGFPYDPARDTEVEAAGPIPAFGRPTCKDWWENANAGLRAKMAATVGTVDNLRTKVASVFSAATGAEIDDQLARLALTKASPSYIDPERIIGDDRGTLSKALHAPSDVLGVFGAAYEGFKASATMMPLITLLTMMQPLILMGLYTFLPLVAIFSGYSLQVMLTGTIAIFTVKFWSVMWYLARWLDDHLIEAMYPGANGNVLMEAITTGLDGSYKRMILNIVMLALYIGLPMLWSGMMAWIGVNLSSALGRVYDSTVNTGVAAGQTGAQTAGRIAARR